MFSIIEKQSLNLLLGIIVFTCSMHLGSLADNGCTITLPTDIPEVAPVYLTAIDDTAKAYTLLKPTGERTTLPVNSRLLLVCAGSSSNVIQLVQQKALELFCRSGGVFESSAGVHYILAQLSCKSIPSSELLLTSERCANNRGYIFKAGFVYETDKFASLFRICYDNITEHTFYTHNTLNGAAINYNIAEDTRRAFRANGMKLTTTTTNKYYTINSQIAHFKTLFDVSQAYVSKINFLARGHLTPDADFIFGYEQLATYFYTNVAPEYQVVNAGNWLRVENLARSLAAEYGHDLETYNGHMGILELPLSEKQPNKEISIYLDATEQLEVPKYFFKVIKDVSTDAAIVMITLNNPFASNADEFCTNVCTSAGVNSDIFADESRGYTFCCTLADFRQHYDDLPDNLSATTLLRAQSLETPSPEEPRGKEPSPSTDGCVITLPTDIPNPEPVYIVSTKDSSRSTLFRPQGEVTTLPVGSNLTLFCAGNGNTLMATEQQTLLLTCRSDYSFYSAEKAQEYKIQELKCARIPTSDLLMTSEKCADGAGYFYEVGFQFTDTDFLSVFTICYDNATEHTLYSRNIINGLTQNYKIVENTRRAFRANGMRFTTNAANTFYTISNQIARFEALFGASQAYVSKSNFLARGHLTPDADFIFGYEQLATYFYTNVAPEYQVVNAGNWLRVENLARSLAAQHAADLLAYTGTLGILQLPTNIGKMKPIYVDTDEGYIEAPIWYYKVLMSPVLPQGGLVLITLNNPFAIAKDMKEFCSNVCEAYGVDSSSFTDTSRGYTFCCTVKAFNEAVSDLPTFDLPASSSG